MGRGNPNPKNKFTQVYDEPVASRSVSVKLPLDIDAYVRSLPNRTEWLRKAIAAQVERDKQEASQSSQND